MWSKYISKFDKLIEEAMCVCARESLKSIYGTLHGNGIMVPSTLLYISVNIHDQKVIALLGTNILFYYHY